MEVGILHVDAHADLRERYEGTPLSHACVMRRAVDLGFAVHQLGVRSLSREEQEFREASDKLSYQDARDFWFKQRPRLILPDNFPESVHISLDLDGLDVSLMPATGAPEPGGLFWGQLMALLEDAARTRRILSADVVELAPAPGLHGCDYLAARLVYAVMGLVQRQAR
jgi:agmatinase